MPPDRLVLATQGIDQLPIDREAKAALTAMLTAAANPNAEHPMVVLKTLEQERQEIAAELMTNVGGTFDAARQRGRRGLTALSAEEWAALVDEANAE